MTQERLARCLEPGQSILVASVDAAGTPSCCRAVAIASDDNLQTLTVYLPVATSQAVIQDVATTKRLAVAATHPRDNNATQLKGTTIEARIARDDEAPIVRARLDAWAGVLERIGVPRRLTRSVAHWPAFAIVMRVEQIFEQTPGPNAGTRLR